MKRCVRWLNGTRANLLKISVWFIYTLLRKNSSSCYWHGATLSRGNGKIHRNILEVYIYIWLISGARPHRNLCKPVFSDGGGQSLRVRVSDADCQEPEGASQPELRHPAGHPVRLRHCQGHQAARGVVSVMVFLPSHKQVAYIIIVDILALQLFKCRNDQTFNSQTLFTIPKFWPALVRSYKAKVNLRCFKVLMIFKCSTNRCVLWVY